MLDEIREHPRETLTGILDRRKQADPAFRTPASVRMLSWLFLDPGRRSFFGNIMTGLLRVRSRP